MFWCCPDQPRVLSRFGDDKNYPIESAKMLATAIHLLRGTPYIYQGEEIGMTNAYFDNIEQYHDVESINYYYIMKEQGIVQKEIYNILQAKSLDNARTPMQWNDEINAGFSKARSWLEVNRNYKNINVAANLNDENSIFYHYQKLIKLRKEYSVISDGQYVSLMEDDPKIYAYKRILDNEEVILLNNFYGDVVELNKDYSDYEILIDNYHDTNLVNLCLKPCQSIALYKRQQ